MLITFCGPACSGKDTIVGKLDSFKRLTQHTTRPMRPGEQEGVEYFFHKSKDEINDPFSLKEFTVANGDKWYYWFEYDDVVKAIESDELFITISDVDGTIKFFNRGAHAIIINVPVEERIKRYYNREIEKSDPNFKEAMRRIIADIDDFQVFNDINNFFTSHWGKDAMSRVHQIDNTRDIEDVVNEVTSIILQWSVSNKSQVSKKVEESENSKSIIGCEECIYINNCPCGWSKNNAACLIIRQIDEE